MEKRTKFEQICYEAFIKFIGMVGVLCVSCGTFISFIWSVGAFIHADFKEGIVASLVFFLSIIWGTGAGQLYEKLEIKKESDLNNLS